MEIEEIKKMGNVIEFNGVLYAYEKDLCEEYGINCDLYYGRKRAGWSIEEALELVEREDAKPRKCKITFEGKVYESYSDLCRERNVNISTFNKRKWRGYSIEDCIYGRSANKEKYTYEGKVFKTIAEISKEYGIKHSVLISRLTTGYSLKEAIEGNLHSSIEFNGIVYKNERDICEKFGVAHSTFRVRKKKGLSLAECLFGGQRKSDNPEKYRYKGKCYPSLCAVCKEYDLKYNTMLTRINSGLSLEDAIEGKVKGRTYKNVTYNGVSYTTQKELCEALGVNLGTFKDRKKKGWTLEECINGRNK